MCKFHKDVARDIATDPATGAFDAGKYCVALTAMAKFRIEQYMPPMHGCDGFAPEVMTTETAVRALDASGLKKPEAEIKAFRDAHIGAMRAAMALTASSCDLSMEGLNMPDIITREGYKHCARMAPDPTKNGPFLDEAVVQLFEGYDDAGKTWARGKLSLAAEAHKPEFEALRAATEHFIGQPGVVATLQTMFENSLVSVFEHAREDAEAGRGVKSDGCVMCGHGSRAQEQNPRPKP
jgi:hypothetical protein